MLCLKSYNQRHNRAGGDCSELHQKNTILTYLPIRYPRARGIRAYVGWHPLALILHPPSVVLQLPYIPISTMSNSSNTTACFSTFRSILDAALKEYKKATGQDLQTHPLTGELDHCDFPDAILEIFQQQANALDETGKCNQTLMKWLNPTVHILVMLSATPGEGVGSVSFSELIHTVSPSITFYFQPFFCGKIIFTGIYVLLGVHFSPMLHCLVFLVSCDKRVFQVTKDVAAGNDVLVNLFKRIQEFLTRLNVYSRIPLTNELISMLGQVMAEVLSILALSTKEMQQNRISELISCGYRLFGPLLILE